MKEEKFFGPKFYKRITYVGNYGQESDNGYTELAPDNTSWIPAGPYHCIVINNDDDKVLGASQSFTVTGPPDPATIKVLTPSVLPGQTLYADVYNPDYTVFTPITGDYLRVYKVLYDVTNNLTELNTVGGTAKFVSSIYFDYRNSYVNYSAIARYVSWKEPGMYQIVMLSDYNQVFRGISNVFEVRAITRSKNTTVTMELNSTHAGQIFNVTIYKPNPPYGSQIGIAYIPAGHKVVDYVNGKKEWISSGYDSGTWNSNTTNLIVTTSCNEWRFGLYYKAVVLAGGIVIGVSKPIQIKRPIIEMRIPLPKRSYSQWEFIPIIVNGGYSYSVFSKSQPDSYYNNATRNDQDSSMGGRREYGYPISTTSNGTVITFPPGMYNIRQVRYTSWWGNNNHIYFALHSVISIPNTTFRVIKNSAQITIADNKTNFNYGDILNFSLTTTNKVPLHGPIHIDAKKLVSSYSIAANWRVVATLEENGQQESANTSDTLYGTIPISAYTFGCPYENSTYYSQLQAACTDNGTHCEGTYSSIISINMTTGCNTR